MRLGGFYGLTAFSLLLLDDEREVADKIAAMNADMNATILKDLSKEFLYLGYTVDNFPFMYDCAGKNDARLLLKKCSVKDHHVECTSDEDYNSLLYALAVHMALLVLRSQKPFDLGELKDTDVLDVPGVMMGIAERVLQDIDQTSSGKTVRDNYRVYTFNQQHGRLKTFVTRTDKAVKVSFVSKCKLDAQGNKILKEGASPEDIRKHEAFLKRAKDDTKTRDAAASAFVKEKTIAIREANPGKIVAMVLGVPEGGFVDYGDLTQAGATDDVIDIDTSKTTERIIMLDREAGLQFITDYFDGKILEDEKIVGPSAAWINLQYKVDPKAEEQNKIIAIMKVARKPGEVGGRKKVLTASNYIPLKVYDTVNVSEIKTAEDAVALNNNINALLVRNKLEDLTASDRTRISPVDGGGYEYSGISISKLVADKSSWTQEISDAKQDNITTVDGDDLTVNIITFKVQAKNYATAVMYVDNNISLDSDLNVTQAVGYTTVSDDNEEITLISEDTIRESLPNITIVEDKVLTNTVTGAQAVILTDTGYALVGNQIIVSDTLMETDINGKVYYNLDIICCLLSNAQLRSLTTKELYIVENAKSEKTVDFYSSLDVMLGQVYTLKRGNTRYYNASNISGVSKLIRKFTVIDGDDKIPVYFILNLSYVVPSLELFENYKLDSFNDSDNSLAKMSEIFYTKPTTTALADWWDSNYGMTNSLCNFMYGTKGVEYVKSGYVVPSMVVLRTSAIKDNTISSIFTSNGFQPDATTKKYCESSTKWWKKYYGNCMSTDYLNALANQTRTIKFYDGKKSGSGMDYGSKFYVTDSGIVYESVGADDRITYKDKSLRIRTRTSSQVTINKDTVFSYGGNEWIFLGTTADGSKYKIIPKAICFTHYHADHTLGLPGLLATLSNAERTDPLIIIGPKGLMRTVNAALTLISKLPFEIKCIECTEESMSLDLFGLKVTMFLVNHGVPCYGYSFSLSRSGKCDPDKAKKNGVPSEIWTDLQHNKVIRMNGRVFTKDLIMGEARKGLKVTYTTDTRPCGNIVKFAKGSDLFICEGMYGSDDNLDNAVKNYHMTFSEAASLARDAHVEQMWLTHYSPGLVDPEKYISNATNIFKRTMCAYDTLSTVLEYQ